MTHLISRSLAACAFALAVPFLSVHSAELPAVGKRVAFKLAESPPQSDAEQLRLRLHALEEPPPFDVTQETFEILVPSSYRKGDPHGLFIWINASDKAGLPAAWDQILEKKKLIFIGARSAGNPRNLFDRMRLAIDANADLRKLYDIDGRRVYVSGFSGGARVASMLGVCYGEMFSGAACFMGVNFYTDVIGSDGRKYGLNYLPDDQVLDLAKRFCRYALVTGARDFNRPNTLAVLEQGFLKEGFANARVFDLPDQGHSLPPADVLAQVIDYLDEGKPPAGTLKP